MDIFDIIRKPFGFLIHWLYSLTGSYLIAILAFALVLKLVLFPFGIKQQKNSQKQAALRPKENVIRKKYAGRTDRATQLKMNTEIQEMYQKENYSPFAGCLPMLLQMLVLIAVYAVVRQPLTYTSGISKDTAKEVQATVVEMAYKDGDHETVQKILGVAYPNLDEKKTDKAKNDAIKKYNNDYKKAFKDAESKFVDGSESVVINYINDCDEKKFEEAYNARKEKSDKELDSSKKVLKNVPDLEVFNGFDLGIKPDLAYLSEKGATVGKKLLVLVPVLSLITSYLGQAITRKFSYQPQQAEEVKSQMRMMNIFMPLFSLFIAFNVNAAVGIYWVMSNALSPVQQIVLSKMFPIKEITPEEMKEAERLYGGKQKKKKGNTATGKKKSLVYDDDDEYESVSNAPQKNVLKEKKESDGDEIVEKAPLKD